MNFDFLGIPLNGTPPKFCERLLRSGRIDTTQGISNEDDTYIVHVYVPEIRYDSIPLMISYNPFSSMVYQVYLTFDDDIGLSEYSRLFDLIVERYGEEYIKLPNKEVIGWNFDEGRITLMRSETTTIISFEDNANNPDADFEDITEDGYINLIE